MVLGSESRHLKSSLDSCHELAELLGLIIKAKVPLFDVQSEVKQVVEHQKGCCLLVVCVALDFPTEVLKTKVLRDSEASPVNGVELVE